MTVFFIPDGSGTLGATKQLTYGTVSPATESGHTWYIGDIRINIDPTSNVFCWKCTVGGGPGTWVALTGTLV
jgi:hypothetical protein